MQKTDTPQKPHVWLWTLVAFAFLSQTALNMARPQMSYKLFELGANEALIGMLTALYALVPVFMAISFGRYTEKVGNFRYTVLIGGVMIGMGAAVMALAPNIIGVGLASVLLGFGHLRNRPAADHDHDYQRGTGQLAFACAGGAPHWKSFGAGLHSSHRRRSGGTSGASGCYLVLLCSNRNLGGRKVRSLRQNRPHRR